VAEHSRSGKVQRAIYASANRQTHRSQFVRCCRRWTISIPKLNSEGELPGGIHTATLREVARVFGSASGYRDLLFQRIQRLHEIAFATGHLARFVVYGSFVTSKPNPNDVDVFMVYWQTKRDSGQRGIVEVLESDNDR